MLEDDAVDSLAQSFNFWLLAKLPTKVGSHWLSSANNTQFVPTRFVNGLISEDSDAAPEVLDASLMLQQK